MKMRVKTDETIVLKFEGADEDSAATAAEAFLSESL
jgi:hypothetical protein